MIYYNENDPQIVAWLRELRAEGLIPDGTIDERSIEDVNPNDCAPTSHFFAGIGGWACAFQLAGWPAGAPVWTGSCPCQPFSPAGKRGGFADPRHLWPAWKKLIGEYRPPTIFGEQVAGSDGLRWLARIRADLEASGYAFGASDLCAASVGAPQRRQRLWWVADIKGERYDRRKDSSGTPGRPRTQNGGGVGVTSSARPQERESRKGIRQAPMGTPSRETTERTSNPGGLGDADSRRSASRKQTTEAARYGHASLADGGTGFWSRYDLTPCLDGKSRRIEPGTFPLAHGVQARVGRLRGYGNAIVPQVAAVFVRAYMEARGMV